MGLNKTIYYLLISARPRQWLKNLSVFAAIFFGGRLLSKNDFILVGVTFLVFCLLSSAMYLLNDIVDFQADQAHFSKKTRPIASQLLSRSSALLASLFLICVGLIISFKLSILLFLASLTFLIIQILYSLFLKQVIILDVMLIAFGFMLRVFAGSFVVGVSLSSWLILSVMMLSLFLAIGKRRSEVTILTHQQAAAHRQILTHYPLTLLDGLTFMMATSTLITYSLFTFNTSGVISSFPFNNFLATSLSYSKWLMVTIPLVVYGVFRYLYLIFEKKEGESPEKVLLSDRPLFATVLIWLITTFIIIHLFNF